MNERTPPGVYQEFDTSPAGFVISGAGGRFLRELYQRAATLKVELPARTM